jgi:VanZ family protein
MNKKLIFTTVLVIYTILLLFGAFNFEVSTSTATPGFDKVLHFGGFFVLSILLLTTLGFYNVHGRSLITVVVALTIGIIIEFVQIGIPGRDFELLDIFADLVGILIGMVVVWSFSKQ